MKRKKVSNPCFLCEKASVECDNHRPCNNCLKMGTPHMCIGSELGSNVSAAPSFPVRTTSRSKPVVNQQPVAHSTQTTQGHAYQSPKVEHPPTPVTFSLPHDDHQKENQEKNNLIASNRSIPTNQSESTTNASQQQQVPNYQMNVNSFLMAELKKLREDQQRLNEELLALKIQNMKLSSKYDSMSQALAKASPLYLQSGVDPQKAMVVFDLTKNPAIVLTTNDTFCKMLGYEMKEVLGMPWHKFIPPEYIERTLAKLGQLNFKDSVIQFDQIYRHKDGGVFPALDTHTIFFANGKPVSDLVFISLISKPVSTPSQRPKLLLDNTSEMTPDTYSEVNLGSPIITAGLNPSEIPSPPIDTDSFSFSPFSIPATDDPNYILNDRVKQEAKQSSANSTGSQEDDTINILEFLDTDQLTSLLNHQDLNQTEPNQQNQEDIFSNPAPMQFDNNLIHEFFGKPE